MLKYEKSKNRFNKIRRETDKNVLSIKISSNKINNEIDPYKNDNIKV